jgi:hypothetical protein
MIRIVHVSRIWTAAATALILTAGLLAGCERKEKILDIETPEGGIEVERSLDSGEIDVEVEDKRGGLDD